MSSLHEAVASEISSKLPSYFRRLKAIVTFLLKIKKSSLSSHQSEGCQEKRPIWDYLM
jgi:hypothetical protein